MHHSNLEIHDDHENGLHLRYGGKLVMRLWHVFITTVDEHQRENMSGVYVLAPDEKTAKSQAGCSRPEIVNSTAYQVPFLIRGFGNLTA